nr:MAG TPA: hypothetical protein [Caudoviricetes sp.]
MVPDTLHTEYLRCWIHRPAVYVLFYCFRALFQSSNCDIFKLIV